MIEKATIKGAVKQAAGKTKAVVGRATGDRSLQARGESEAALGKAQKAAGSVISKVKSALR